MDKTYTESESYNVHSCCPNCNSVMSIRIEAPTSSILERLKTENARYRKALEKYANPETHSMDEDGEVWYGDYFDYKTALS